MRGEGITIIDNIELIHGFWKKTESNSISSLMKIVLMNSGCPLKRDTLQNFSHPFEKNFASRSYRSILITKMSLVSKNSSPKISLIAQKTKCLINTVYLSFGIVCHSFLRLLIQPYDVFGRYSHPKLNESLQNDQQQKFH